MVFPGVVYRCEGWAVEKAECGRTDTFELWFWRRLLRVPWSARRSNQSILQEINPEYSLEGLVLNSNTLVTWQAELTLWKRPWCWERWGQEKKGTTEDEMVGWHHWFNGHELGQTPGNGEGQGSLACCSPQGCKESDMTWRLSDKRKLKTNLSLPNENYH